MTSIGESAFSGCSSLTSITIPSSVTNIGNCAFNGCSALTSITIPSNVKSIEEYAFTDCSALTSIEVENGNSVYDSRNNCNALIETSSNKLVQGCQNSVIPNSVTSIGEAAFSSCSSLTSITIPSSVTSIGGWAFAGCLGLSSITNYAATPQTMIGYNIFYNVSTSSVTLHVLPGCKAAYEAADYWKDFNIVEDAVEPTTTGVNAISTNIPNNSDAIYSISGHRLNAAKNGINIINGKKYLVK